MKKFFIFLILFFIILLAALLIFVITFDANRYKDVLIEKIGQSVDKEVTISNISLNILPKIALRIDGFSVKPILKISSIEANINPLPLLKKDIQIQHINVRGLRIDIRGDSFGKKDSLSTKKDIEAIGAVTGGLSFLARSLHIEDSFIKYEGGVLKEPLELEIIDAYIKNITLYGPIDIDIKASIFGRGRKNLNVNAVFYPEIEDKTPYLKNFKVALELEKLDISKIISTLGAGDMEDIASKEFSGELVLSSEKIPLNPKEIFDTSLYINLSKGYTSIVPIKERLSNIELDAEFNRRELLIKNLQGSLGTGAISCVGKIKDLFRGQDLDLDIALEDLDISDFLPERSLSDVGFEGILNLDTHISSKGLSKDKLIDTLKSEGKAKLDKAVLKNLNILVRSFEKLDMIPGLVEKLKNTLPLRYQEILRERDTRFRPMKVDFRIEDGEILFRDFLIESDSFYLITAGSLGMDRYLDMDAQLFIPAELSDAFAESVGVLRYLKDSKGMITMPLMIKGQIPDVKVMPDLNYVIQKLAVSKGQELLGDILRKSLPSSTPQTEGESGEEKQPERGMEDESQAPQRQPEPEEIIIKTIFDIFGASGQK